MILVTGGAGYIGSFTVRELINNGWEVVVLDSLENGHEAALSAALGGQGSGVSSKLHLEIVDLADIAGVRRVFDTYPIEAVIDFVAYLSVGESMENPKKYMINNVENFIKLLDVMREKGCKYIIKSSTAAVYGDPEDKYFPLEENYLQDFKPGKSCLLEGHWDGQKVKKNEFLGKILESYQQMFALRQDLLLTDEEKIKLMIPSSVYGLTKLFDEIIMEKYDKLYGIKCVALRYFNVCGASLDGKMGDDKPEPTNLMTRTILSILGNLGKLQVFGNDYPTKDGTGVRDYIHPLDLADGHVKALKLLLDGDKSDVFNLGTGTGYSVLEVLSEVEKASGRKINYKVVDRRPGDPAVSYANPKRANDKLNWKAKYSLADMAVTAWKWHSTHLKGYGD
ncbi:MAG: UDP-glucose 4-epimerase [bacterium]|nr:UDP-glucose 4-epimerase [bacterium]